MSLCVSLWTMKHLPMTPEQEEMEEHDKGSEPK